MATKLEPLEPLPAARQKQSLQFLAVPASEIVRLVPPSGLVLNCGVLEARGVHRLSPFYRIHRATSQRGVFDPWQYPVFWPPWLAPPRLKYHPSLG